MRNSISRAPSTARVPAASLSLLGAAALSLAPVGLAAQSDALQEFEGPSSEPLRYERKLTLPNLDIELTLLKIVDPATGNVTGGTVDANGNAVELKALLAAEAQLRSATPSAKLTDELTRAFEADPEATLPVVLWLSYDADLLDQHFARLDGALGEEATNAELEAVEAAHTAFSLEYIQGVNSEALNALGALGATIRYTSTSAPVIFIDASRNEALAIAALPEIDTLYLESFDEQDTNNSARGTHRATTTYNLGWRGSGVRVAVLENNGIDPDCPHLVVSGWFNAGNPNPDDHVHGTSGCIASRLASRRGHAPNVTLFSANAASYSDTNITQAADWIIGRNIAVTNMSFGGSSNGALQYKDRYFDYQSRRYQDSYVASAGNGGNFVGSPGTAWNCVTVGAFNDQNSTNWSGDSISSFSDFRDPNTGCEKPNLAATGQGVDTIGQGPDWLRNGYSGTSFSSPFTAGSIAVTISRDGSANASPEAAMAAAMASAWHNIEGATRLSERDGAGGLHQRASARMGNRNGIRYVTLNSGSFNRNGYYTYNINCNAGDRTRVAIAWGARANAAYTSTVLDADLDITILRGSNQTSGTSYGSSSSGPNNFEIVEFTPPTSGTYTVRINDWRFNGSSERVGIAWSQRNRDQGN